MTKHTKTGPSPRACLQTRKVAQSFGCCLVIFFIAMTFRTGLDGAKLPAEACPAGESGMDAANRAIARADQPPRKVLVGTVVGGYDVYSMPLDDRLRKMNDIVDAIAARGQQEYPGQRLDLVVLPEYFLGRPGATLAEKTVRLQEVLPQIAACAKRHHCYLVVPMLLRESDSVHMSNAAVLVDRNGHMVGIYRKVHPVASAGSDIMEGGLTPGSSFPVFDCDFGRLGIQICFDMLYADGWDALARQGAEIVALPSASPETVHPCMYALQHGYYIVSATPKDCAAVYNPLGLIDTQATKEGTVAVDQIDLSYAVLHWDEKLEGGEALRRIYGDRIGFKYYQTQDAGIFWSNDRTTTIGQMIAKLGLMTSDANVERLRLLQNSVRGGPPAAP